MRNFFSLSSFSSLASPLSATEEFPAEHLAFFEKKIQPVPIDKCYKCHAVTSKKLKADLYLDSREGMLKGGKSQTPPCRSC